MADEGTTGGGASTSTKSAKAQAAVKPMLVQSDWLPYLENSSAWMWLTSGMDPTYGADTISVDGLDYRQALRAEHAARIILEIYGYQVQGSIDPLRLVVEEA